jgi:single-strand DNA-binding protein
MSGDAKVEFTGNLTADPELRFLASGDAVCSFQVAVTPRVLRDDKWTDGDTSFFRCTAWRLLGENVAASLTKGARVMVTGRVQQRSYETNEGDKRTVWEIQADEVGPSLAFATATLVKAGRTAPWLAAVAGEPPF